ncbi:MAG: hypothetical protein ACFB0G_08380 [Leptolyngbyaceae cyanobacterium]
MPNERHPELEGYQSQPLYTFELKRQGSALRNKVLWTLLGLTLGVGMTVGASQLWPALQLRLGERQSVLAEDDPFRQAFNQAMSAAELTQTADFKEDWSQVAILWQQAISSMQSVSPSHPNYDVAQQKLVEYDRNLKYAQSNVDSRAASQPNAQSYWTIGSDRELVLKIQGMPIRVNQHSTTCKEVMYYGNSTVELQNGYVVDYSDLDRNLTVLGDEQVALSVQPRANTWTLGSTQEEVFQAQGTPTRTSTYQDAVTLHYNESIVELVNNRVVGYTNLIGNLKVSMVPAAGSTEAAANWGLGSNRTAVLHAEQTTPTAVSRVDNSCEEIFNFDNSTVTFRRGLVTEYSNLSKNLSIQ